MTPHFSLGEFTHSDTALRHSIDNALPDDRLPAATQTLEMLERIRSVLSALADRDIPMMISSGYRGEELNRAVGSRSTSDHIKASAADWTAPSFGSPYDICRALEPRVAELGIGQLIHEFGGWVHTSTRATDRPINRIITISRAGVAVGIREV
jgi:zinc D-Ala-D-Ala carboxypeptidase